MGVDERPVGSSRSSEPSVRRQIIRQGLIVWFDPAGKTKKAFGVKYPVGGMLELGTRDIGVIALRYQSGIFGFASRNFYTEFLAASAILSGVWRLNIPTSSSRPKSHHADWGGAPGAAGNSSKVGRLAGMVMCFSTGESAAFFHTPIGS